MKKILTNIGTTLIAAGSMVYMAQNWENAVDVFLSAIAMVFIFIISMTVIVIADE